MGFFTSRSFRVDILTAFGTLLVITFLAVQIYNYRSSSAIVLMLCDDLIDQTSQIVIDKTAAFLKEPAELAEFSARLFNTGILTFDNQSKLEKFAIECIISLPQMAMFLAGDQKGNFVLAKPEKDGSIATKFVNKKLKPPLITWKYWDKNLESLITETNTTDTYDPRLRPWFKEASIKKSVNWTDLYIFYTGKKPGITVSYPIINLKGTVTGVIGCDIELIKLSDFLQSLKIGKGSQIFIINEKNELVAFSDHSKIVIDPDETDTLHPHNIYSLNISSVTGAFEKFQKIGSQKFALEVDGERYRAAFTDFPSSFGKQWKVGIVVPENNFIGGVKELTNRATVICLFFLILAIFWAVLLARRISKPILQLAAETDNIRKLNLDKPLVLKSRISEIEILNGAINRMKVSLRSFMRFAPEQLVHEVILDGKELMLGGDRREVTLLFSDLRNFTHFAERTRPEDVVQILNIHFDAMVRIISDHGGYVVDFLGDSLFAVFGAPKNDPDHALQAIKCALTMQLTRKKLNKEVTFSHLPELEMGIGINSGSCVVGNMGSQMRIKYGVVGHAVNLAARIETFTVGGQILISEASRLAASELIDVIGPFEAYGKGVEGAIKMWELRGLVNSELTLPPTVPGLVPLSQPLTVEYRLVTGKQIAPELHHAQITKLSQTGAAILTNLSLDDFSAIQIKLINEAGEAVYLDGKIVGADDGNTDCIIRFSPLDEPAAAAISKTLVEFSKIRSSAEG